MNVSGRMSAALEGLGRSVPDEGEPTGNDYLETILRPLAEMPELERRIWTNTRVLAVGRRGHLKHHEVGSGRRQSEPFRILARRSDGEEFVVYATCVIDCTGSLALPNALGDGGIPALGEGQCSRLSRQIPDVDGDPERWGGKTVLVVGSGHSAQTAVVDLARLGESVPGTRVIWLRKADTDSLNPIPDDPLPGRAALVGRARELVEGGFTVVDVRYDKSVEALNEESDGARVTLGSESGQGGHEELWVDWVLGLTGSVGDHTIYRQLQIHECYATLGPMKLASALAGASGAADCLSQVSHGVDALANPEPNFYIVGAKSYGRTNSFLLRVGWDQITDLFSNLALSVSD